MIKQVFVKVSEDPFNVNFCSIDALLLVRLVSEGRIEPSAETWEEFMIRKRAELDYLTKGFGVLGDESGVGILFCH